MNGAGFPAPDPETGWLISGVFLILILAWAGAALLRARFSPGGQNVLVENLAARIGAWWAIAALLAIAMLGGRGGVVVLFALISFAALREFVTLTAKSRADHWALAAAFFVILPVQYLLVYMDWYRVYSVFIPVYAFLYLPVLSAIRNSEPERFLARVSENQWGLMICVYAASHVPALLSLQLEGAKAGGILLIAFLVILVQITDTLQYAWSQIWGRHPIAPALSASKTWEGLAGAVVSGAALGAALWWLTPFSPWATALLGAAITATGLFGSLVMSAIKRGKGVRDWGQLVAGQGGFIDRLDGVVFAAPVFFHLVRFFWAAI